MYDVQKMYKMLENVQTKFYVHVAYGFPPCPFGLQVASVVLDRLIQMY